MGTQTSLWRPRLRRTRTATALAAVGALLMSIGIVGLTAPAASANSVTCDSLGFSKFDAPSGNELTSFGSMTWSGKTLSYVVNSGFTVALCIKSGSQAGTTTFTVVGPSTGSKTISQGISHVGWKVVPSVPTQPAAIVDVDEQEELDCTLGYRSRTVTTTKEYVWNGTAWVVEDQSGWQVVEGGWSTYRPLTEAERASLECGGEQPPALRVPTSDFQASCELGYRSREGVIVKEYVESEQGWVLEPESEWTTTWGDWGAYRPLTEAERASLECGGEQPPALRVPTSDSEASCELGYRSREGVIVKEYVESEQGWVLEPSSGWTTEWAQWSGYRALTEDEKQRLGCDDPPPPPPTDVCTNIDGLQTSVPEGFELVDGLCVEIRGVQEIAPAVVFADPDCKNLDGASWDGNLETIVDYEVVGEPGLGEDITVTATIEAEDADEYVFADGAQTSFSHSYPAQGELECVLGEETIVPSPKPDAEPTVKGVERVAVPTAVAAGVGHSAAAASSSQILAQLLVAGGILLLMAGAWIGFGRRETGAHEA